MALHLLAAGFITDHVLQEISELNEIKADKATRLYTAILGVIKNHPHKIYEFVSVLETHQSGHELAEELRSALCLTPCNNTQSTT